MYTLFLCVYIFFVERACRMYIQRVRLTAAQLVSRAGHASVRSPRHFSFFFFVEVLFSFYLSFLLLSSPVCLCSLSLFFQWRVLLRFAVSLLQIVTIRLPLVLFSIGLAILIETVGVASPLVSRLSSGLQSRVHTNFCTSVEMPKLRLTWVLASR